MNIVLVGMRGSGKTAVGKLLAEKLGKRFIEMDELIVQKMGMSIPEIVSKHCWDNFREVEAELCREVAQLDDVVNATGGGVVTRQENIRELRKKGKLVWLDVSLDTLLQRIGDDSNRPSLTGKSQREDMETILKERRPIYERAADYIIDTEDKTPEEIAEVIVQLWKGRGLK